MKQIIYVLTFFILGSCSQNAKRDNQAKSTTNSIYSNGSGSNSSFNLDNSDYNNYHTDPNYKYEYRTGSSGNYEYNYDISGYDEDGNSVSGNIDIEGKFGSGYIEVESGNEKSIEVEWVDHGVLEGTDEDGNTYELEVD